MTFIHSVIKSIFITDCIYNHHTDGLNENYNNKIILAHFIIKWENFNILNILNIEISIA